MKLEGQISRYMLFSMFLSWKFGSTNNYFKGDNVFSWLLLWANLFLINLRWINFITNFSLLFAKRWCFFSVLFFFLLRSSKTIYCEILNVEIIPSVNLIITDKIRTGVRWETTPASHVSLIDHKSNLSFITTFSSPKKIRCFKQIPLLLLINIFSPCCLEHKYLLTSGKNGKINC